MKKEDYVPKYKIGDCIISGNFVGRIKNVSKKNNKYEYLVLYPIRKDRTELCLWETIDKHLLTSKAENRIIRLLYE